MSINNLSNGKYQVRWRDNTGHQSKKNFSTEKLAQSYENKINLEREKEEIHGKTLNSNIAIQTLVDEHAKLKSKKDSSKKLEKSKIKIIMSYLKDNGVTKLNELNKQIIRQYESYRLETVKQVTVNDDIMALQTVLNFAVDNDRILYSPIKTFKKTPIKKTSKRFLYPDEIKLILNACNSTQDREIIYLILTVGLRISELINLQKADFKNDIISIKEKDFFSPKNGERQISIDKDYANDSEIPKYFKRCKKNSDFLFLNEHENKIRRDTFLKKFNRLLIRAKIENPQEIALHNLRHTHVSYAVARGIDLRTIMENVGISDFKVLLNYSHKVKGLAKNIPNKSKFPWQ